MSRSKPDPAMVALARARLGAGWALADVAASLGVSKSTVHRWGQQAAPAPAPAPESPATPGSFRAFMQNHPGVIALQREAAERKARRAKP